LDTLTKYLHIFRNLHVDRAHGIAPHKPVLLISILQSYQKKQIADQRIFITPDLVSLFKANWNLLVVTNHDCRISYPFYYLKSDKFWKLIPRQGFENINQMGSIMKSFSNLNAVIDHAEINDDLVLLMKDPKNNSILKQFLLDEYFPNAGNNLSQSSIEQQKLFDDIECMILKEDPAEYREDIKKLLLQKNEEEIYLRGSIFKREIPKIYNNTCCISGMKIDASISVSMIDACHVVPFSKSFDDTISNGIALCPNLHRAFDRGLIGIDANYKVRVSSQFKETQSNYSILAFADKEIRLPKQEQYFPALENLKWHNQNIFK
jgi:putative restriction endonuclease